MYRFADINPPLAVQLESISKTGSVPGGQVNGFRAARRKTAAKFCRIRTESVLEILGLDDTIIGTNVDRKVYLRPTQSSNDERVRALERLTKTLRATHLSGETAPFFMVESEGELLRLEIAERDAIPEHAVIVLDGRQHPVANLVTMRIEARFSGEHHPDGIFLMTGPGTASGVHSDSLHVMDIAPTLAVLLDLSFGNNWRGSPAQSGFDPDEVERADYPAPSAAAVGSGEMGEGLKEQLRSMGYLE